MELFLQWSRPEYWLQHSRFTSTCLLSLFTVCIPLAGKDIIFLLRTLEHTPHKPPTTLSVFDPSTDCSTTDIMRERGEKQPEPVEALGEAPKQQPPLLPLWMAHGACHVDLTGHQLAKSGNERRVWEGGSTKVKCSPWAIMINHQQFLCNHHQWACCRILHGKGCRGKSITLYYCGHALLTSVGVHTFCTWFVSTGRHLEQCGQFGQ